MNARFDPVPALVRTGRALLAVPPLARPLLPAAWLGVIWWLSSREPGDGPELFSGFGLVLNTGHAFLYGVLALLCVPLLPRHADWVPLTLARASGVLLFVFAAGLVDEWHQSWVDGRVASGLDVLTDLVGAAAVLATIAALGPEPGGDDRRVPVIRCLIAGFVACWIAGGLSTVLELL